MKVKSDAPARKLREAAFFLGCMRVRSGDSRLDRKDEFAFCFSAFLNAAYSVEQVLMKGYQQGWQRERQSWHDRMDGRLQCLVNALHEERRVVVHAGHDSTVQSERPMPALHIVSPSLAPWAYDEGATIDVSAFSIKLAGANVPAIEVCESYLAALNELASRCMA